MWRNIRSIKVQFPLIFVSVLTIAIILMWILNRVSLDKVVNNMSDKLSSQVQLLINSSINGYIQSHENFILQSGIIFANPNLASNQELIQKKLWDIMKNDSIQTNLSFVNTKGIFTVVDKDENGLMTAWSSDPDNPKQLKGYSIDSQGKKTDLKKSISFDLSQRPWYQRITKLNQPDWSSPYFYVVNQQLVTKYTIPVVDPASNKLLGYYGGNILLSKISDFLQNIDISPFTVILIAEKTGEVIASSLDIPLWIKENNDIVRLHIDDIDNQYVKSFYGKLIDQYGALDKVNKFQAKIYLNHQPYNVNALSTEKALDCLIITLIPQSDFVEIVNVNEKNTFYFVVLILVGIGFTGTAVTHYFIVGPLKRLNKAAKDVQYGKFNAEILSKLVNRTDEIGETSKIFKDMALVITDRENDLSEQVHQLRLNLSESEKRNLMKKSRKIDDLRYLQQLSKQIRATHQKHE